MRVGCSAVHQLKDGFLVVFPDFGGPKKTPDGAPGRGRLMRPVASAGDFVGGLFFPHTVVSTLDVVL